MARRSTLFLPVALTSIAVVATSGCATATDSPEASSVRIKIEEDRRAGSSQFLLDKLAGGDPDERVHSARAMGRIQSPAYLDALDAALADQDSTTRLAALFAIGQLGLVPNQAVDPRATEFVLPHLRDPEPKLVAAALNALGKLAHERMPADVFPLLTHADAGVRAEAAFALFRYRFAPLWRGQVDEPPELPDAAAEALISTMRDSNPDVRFAATYAFSRYGDVRARRALIEATVDREARVRLFAVRGLGHVANAAAVPHLIARLGDDNSDVRVEAVAALQRASRFEGLERVISDPSFHVRAAVAQALGAATSMSSLDTLRGLTEDASVTVRVAAIEALSGRLGPAALGRIETWAASEDWRIRAAAAGATGHMGEAGDAAAAAAFADPDLRVQAAVLNGLSGRGDGDDIVIAAIARDDLAIRGAAVALLAEREHLDRVEMLTAAYDASTGQDWIEVRESIADALGTIDGAETMLRRVVAEDPAPSVRGKAAAALNETLPEARREPPYTRSRLIDFEPPHDVHVDLETVHGTMRIELLSAHAPIHVAAFLERVDEDFYDGLIWHRVVSNFVIQGGDPRGDGWGSGGESLRDEINEVRFERGMLGMPKAGKDTGGCQLFITHVPTPHLDGNYTVFGRVVSGIAIVDAIEVGDEILDIRRVEID